MSSAVFWYVQARLQARHGERMDEAHWHALEGAQSFLTYLDRTRSTPVSRFTELVPADASAHLVERRLREARRGYAEEIASWMPASWRRAVRWAALLPELPMSRLSSRRRCSVALDDGRPAGRAAGASPRGRP